MRISGTLLGMTLSFSVLALAGGKLLDDAPPPGPGPSPEPTSPIPTNPPPPVPTPFNVANIQKARDCARRAGCTWSEAGRLLAITCPTAEAVEEFNKCFLYDE